MSWTSLAHVAFAVAAFYLLWWLYSLEHPLGSIERTSKTDPLTGLGSATWLESERWYAALRSGRPLCVAWFDLDGLKRRNDQSGHAAGDQLIRAAAARRLGLSPRGPAMTLAPSELRSKLLALAQRLQERAAEDPGWTGSLEAVEQLLPLVVAGSSSQSLTRAQLVAFGKLLRDKRNAAGLSRTRLTRRVKLSDATVKFVETARHPRPI